jgi:CBS domain containing-hemolysin-like protein
VLLNGFFVAAEFSLVKIRNTQLKLLADQYGYRGHIATLLHNEQDIYLSACQLGITLTSLALGWIGEPAFANIIKPALIFLNITSDAIISTISIGFGFSVITFLHIVIGEISPKSIAIRSTETVAIWTAVPLYYFHKIMFPIIYLLNECSLYFLKLVGYKTEFGARANYSRDEIKLILDSSINQQHGNEYEIIGNTLELTELSVADLMHPEEDMVVINSNENLKNAIEIVFTNQYSRYPIYKDKKNNIIGIIHVKDIIPVFGTNRKIDEIQISEFMKPILEVSHNYSLQKMFEKFNEGYSHFAIVTNEIKEIVGFVTLDNIISALLGNISDEFNNIRSNWIALKNGSFLMKGSTSIYSVEKALDIDIPSVKNKTISGLITEKLERIPKEKEHIYFQEFSVVIKKMKGPHILLVKIIPLSNQK